MSRSSSDSKQRRSKRYLEKHRQLQAEIAASREPEPDKTSRKRAKSMEFRTRVDL